MPKVSEAHLAARRSQILEAAVVCFARKGLDRATMQDIVAQSKLSPGAIYNYFGSKEEIIETIADERHARERATIADARAASTVPAALARIRDAFFASLDDPAERRRRRVGIQLWAEAQRSPKILALVRRGVDQPRALLRTLIAHAQRRGEIACDLDPDATARFMIAVFQGFVLQLDWDHRTAIPPYLDVIDRCLEGLLTPSSARRRAAVKRGATSETESSAR